MANINIELLESRTKGQFPITIKTSLALEGAFGILLEKPNPKTPPIIGYEELWINISTLFRNFVGVFKAEQQAQLTTEDCAMGLLEEMTIIRSVVEQQTQGKTQVVYYICTHERLGSFFRHALFKDNNTPAMKRYNHLEKATVERLSEIIKESHQQPFEVFDTTIIGHKKRTMLISHFAVDLLSNQDLYDIALLETNTGAVKLKSQWYTKLTDGKDLSRIPFDVMTLQLFGDGRKMFNPYPKEVREALLAVANKYQWTPVTTKERIKLTVGLVRDPVLEGLVTKLYSTFL